MPKTQAKNQNKNRKKHQKMLRQHDRKMAKVKYYELENLKIIGAGSFGKVSLVKHKKHYMALKAIKKSVVEEDKTTHVIIREREILYEMRDCAFIVHLHSTYRSARYVYFLLELCVGGDTFVYSRQFKKKKMPLRNAKFIVACVKEGLEYLHERNYVFRDLKEENILIDARGYCKLSDLAFCVQQRKNLRSFAGTMTHMAPEIIRKVPYDRAVDLWALGITVFGLFTNDVPFKDTSRSIFYNIMHGRVSDKLPKYLSKKTRTFINALCHRNPEQRLGYSSMKELEKSSWFRGFNWKALRAHSMTSPIARVRAKPCDVQFIVDEELMQLHTFTDDKFDAPAERYSGWDADF